VWIVVEKRLAFPQGDVAILGAGALRSTAMRESDTATSRAESAQETCSTACQRDLTSRRRIANLIVCMCVPAWMSCFCRYAWHTILHNQHTSSGDPAGALSPIARHDRACDSTNAGGTAAAERASMPLSSSVRDKPRFESSRLVMLWCGVVWYHTVRGMQDESNLESAGDAAAAAAAAFRSRYCELHNS
jgi:hypothetical protein